MFQFFAIAIAIFFFFLWPIWIFGAAWLSIKRDRRKNAESESGAINRSLVPSASPYIPPAGWNPTSTDNLTQEEVPGIVAKDQLKDSEIVTDLLKSQTSIHVGVIKMVQAGASIVDIKRRYRFNKEELADALKAYDTFREELAGKVRAMLMQGMTREQVVAAMRGELPATTHELPTGLECPPPTPQQQQKPPLAQVELLFTGNNSDSSSEMISQHIPDPTPTTEGTRKKKTNYAVVRSAKLRKAAIAIHGRDCIACGRNFDELYGPELAKGYIEIHHLSSIAMGVRTTDPAKDLVPLCSNCHKMADRLVPPPRTISELKNRLLPSSQPLEALEQHSDQAHRPQEKSQRITRRKNPAPKK